MPQIFVPILILSKTQAGIGDTDLILGAKAPNVSGKSKIKAYFKTKDTKPQSNLFFHCNSDVC